MDFLIIGGGAAGLYTAYLLLQKGHSVSVIEARHRCGGRINSIQLNFSRPIEEGAEFVHGEQSLTSGLIKLAGLHTVVMEGKFWRREKNKLTTEQTFIEGHRKLERHLEELESDCTVNEFLLRHFKEKEDEELLKSVRNYVEGYDAADCDKASALAFKKEWLNDMDADQLRITEGYSAVISYLEKEIIAMGGKIFLNSPVVKINHKEKNVTISSGEKFIAEKIIVTLPTGVLLTEENKNLFHPPLPDKIKALSRLGYGAVIKVLLEFTQKFWDTSVGEIKSELQAAKAAFIFSEEKFPTWWTQLPDELPLLTGWMAGPNAESYASKTETELLEIALESLAEIFRIPKNNLRSLLKSSHVYNWTTDPFTKGAYGYETENGTKYKKQVLEPVNDTLYFAGEGLSLGESSGTVESALQSAVYVVNLLDQ